MLIIGAIWFFSQQGSTPKPVKPEPIKPTPDLISVKPSAEQTWEAFAVAVESKMLGGTMQQHTDHLIKIADTLKDAGKLTDISRVDQWRAKRIDITDANRADIAKKLRGK
jgi:methylaspartate ammonia-lyase